jgi:hypothetical protein
VVAHLQHAPLVFGGKLDYRAQKFPILRRITSRQQMHQNRPL